MQKRPESGKIFLVKTTPENQAVKNAYRVEFVKRTAKIRKDSGLSRSEVAEYLGMTYDTYRKYEESVAMPHHLIPRFLRATRGDPNYLFGMTRRHKRLNLSIVD